MSYLINNDDRHVLFEKKGFFSTGMKLIFCGKQINTCKEQNIESVNKFGFNVSIIYKKDSWLSKAFLNEKHIEKIYNCTQVHYGYTEMGTVQLLTKVAFESDIHRTGFNREIIDIESVEITLSNKKHYDYHIE